VKIGILGGGLSGIVLAYMLQESEKISGIDILEKEQVPGGLCRSYNLNGVPYDIGPHIIFSKNKEVLDLMVNLLGENINKLRRSNKIYFKGKFIKYPFENDLSSLPDEDKMYCLNAFLNNPYVDYEPNNMLQFFLTTFGEGITNSYLRPYNEKIWKYDPSLMDTQMVDRIPKPPAEDIIRSANGIQTEGYLHQLFFYYPKHGGIAALVKAFADGFSKKVTVTPGFTIAGIKKNGTLWSVKSSDGMEHAYDFIISTIPLPVLCKAMTVALPKDVKNAVEGLKHNSIIITTLNLKKDNLGDNFAVMVPDKEIIFHRLSKLNFLMPNSYPAKGTTLLVEITYRKGDLIDKKTDADILERIVNDLVKVGFVDSRDDLISSEIRRVEYAYVIYDLHHKKNMKIIKDFYEDELNVLLCGRFGEYEYLNMDAVIERCLDKTKKINAALEKA